MQKQTQREEPGTLESVRARLATQRTEPLEVETEAVVETVRDDLPEYLLGSATLDVAAALIAGFAPGVLMVVALQYLHDDSGRNVFLGGAGLLVVLWTCFFTLLRPMRTARIALVWPLSLYNALGVTMLAVLAWDPTEGFVLDSSRWLYLGSALGVLGFQAFALWQAYRRR